MVDFPDYSGAKMPPHSIEAESNVLGALMYSPNSWENIDGKLLPDDFYRHDNRCIFNAIYALFKEDTPVDVITVSNYLEQHGLLNDAGGRPYIANLCSETVGATNIAAYAEIIKECSLKRQLISVGTKLTDSGFNSDGRRADELIEIAEKSIAEINDSRTKSGEALRSMNDLLSNVLHKIEENIKLGDGISGLATGWGDFDELTAGLQNADLIVVAGRPSMGKTTIAMNIVEEVLFSLKKSVGVFSLEMTAEQLVTRMLSSVGRIDQTNIRKGKLDPLDLQKLADATKKLASAKLIIDDASDLLPDIRARGRKMKRDNPDLSLIMIDYLQLIKVPGVEHTQKVYEVAEISRSMKMMAKELNVPVVLLSQLNRKLEERGDKRPVMSDLRDSGAIEQDADLICFVYRDEVYNKESPHKGIAELILAKQRNGPTGTVKLAFQGRYSKFSNLSHALSVELNN